MAAALVRTQSPPPFAYTLLKCCLSCPTVYLCNECEYVERIEGSCDRLNVHACLCVSASKGIMVWLHTPHLTCVCEFLGIDVAVSMRVHGLLQDFNSQHAASLLSQSLVNKVLFHWELAKEAQLHPSVEREKRKAYLSSLCRENEVSAFLELSGNHNLTQSEKIILRLLRDLVGLSFSLSAIQVCRFKIISQTKARVWSICSKWSMSSVLVWQLDKRKSVSITDSFRNVE